MKEEKVEWKKKQVEEKFEVKEEEEDNGDPGTGSGSPGANTATRAEPGKPDGSTSAGRISPSSSRATSDIGRARKEYAHTNRGKHQEWSWRRW